jgi:REP element-mobilizing transposase RayT
VQLKKFSPMTLGKPPRLDVIFQRYDPPLYFVTLCTRLRRKILANGDAHCAVLEYGERGIERNVALGRYVIMPDHIHLFVRGGPEFNLGIWVRGLKRVVAAAVTGGRKELRRSGGGDSGNIWQRGFFDHLLRNSESYAQKWNYVRDNPVRAGLANKADDWPFAGEIVRIDRV